MNSSVVLLSGGIDSAVSSYFAKLDSKGIYALTFKYGQSHTKEIECAKRLARTLGVKEHKILELPLDEIGGSSLFNKDAIPTRGVGEGIPSTWVPQRNSVFLAIALGWAEALGADRVYIGVNAVDYSGYPDCRPEFINAMEDALNLASKKYVETGQGIDIMVPIISLTKAKIIEKGLDLGVPFGSTWSCYKGEEKACGVCDSCRIRLKAFEAAGAEDPIEYQEGESK